MEKLYFFTFLCYSYFRLKYYTPKCYQLITYYTQNQNQNQNSFIVIVQQSTTKFEYSSSRNSAKKQQKKVQKGIKDCTV